MRSTRRSRWHVRVAVLCLAGVSLTGAEGAGAKVLLLPAGSRTSIVVELDDETPKATAIEATDNQSVAVEIGPVRGKVINQLLEAAKDSPLVSQVRVRGITQGADGTIITIYVTAKTPVSGSVRRAQRRIYIDLEPLGANGVGPRPPDRLAATEAPKPTQTSGTAPSSTKAAPQPVTTPVPAPRRITTPTPAPRSRFHRQRRPAQRPPSRPRRPPRRSTRCGRAQQASQPRRRCASCAVERACYLAGRRRNRAAEAADRRRHVYRGGRAHDVDAGRQGRDRRAGALGEFQRQAEQLTKIPDVKALERLKADLQAQRSAIAANGGSTSEYDALLVRFDQFSSTRSATSSPRTRRSSAKAPATVWSVPPDFQQSLRPLKPELESVSSALRGWSGGALPPANLQGVVASLLPRLRSLKPPANIATAHSWMCESLDALALMWAKAAVEPPPEGSETAVIDRARQAVDDFLRLEATLSTPPANAAR